MNIEFVLERDNQFEHLQRGHFEPAFVGPVRFP